MSCPTADALAGFAAGALDDAEAAALEAHIDTCESCRAALSSAVREDAPGPTFGRYRVDTVLGAGGMGLVYRAFDPQLARSVAIKVVRRAPDGIDDDAQRARLVREAQSLARLSHAHVCHVYDVGEHDGEVWVAMELIDGVDLRQWALGRPVAEVQAALVDAARGLAAAHAAGLTHRDVKPQNVLMTRAGRAVVTDFGLARADDRATTTGVEGTAATISGTPAYLAPEQLTGAAVDARVDQFAWAVMAWELICGERPFPVEPVARLAAIRAALEAPRGLPGALGATLVRALAAAPRDRFPSIEAMLAALETPAIGARSRRWSVVAAIGALAITGAGVVIWSGRAPAASPQPDAATAAAAPGPAIDAAAAPLESAEAVLDAVSAPLHVAVTTIDAGHPGRGLVDAGTALAASIVDAARITPITPITPITTDAAAGPPTVTPDASAPPSRRFDRERAERVLADCRFPVDPAHPDPALAPRGTIVDWGRVTRRESVLGTGADGEHAMAMYEIDGARARYRLDGDSAAARLGSLDAAIGDLIVVCPYDLPSAAEVDHRTLPPGWRAPSPPVYAFAPTSSPPQIATTLAVMAPLHVPESLLRGLAGGTAKPPRDRALLVWAKPRQVAGARWDMGGWTLDATDLRGADLLAVGRPLWLVTDRTVIEDTGAGHRAVLHGVIALRRLLD
ncbi:MAG: Serine/threonine protein kinase [Deltaproteobacteria bacterium]|nr:Serine/threonine protein kinase [Deltaproteobacteria bacterium]